MKCPVCGYNNIVGSDDCENCQASLVGLEHQESKSSPKASLKKFILTEPISRLKPKDVVLVSEESSVMDAILKMNKIKAGCVLIKNKKGEITGILTERDVLFRFPGKISQLNKIPVSTMMTHHVETLNENNSLAHAMNLMSVKRFRHIPVIRQDGKTGVLSARDILKYFSTQLENDEPTEILKTKPSMV